MALFPLVHSFHCIVRIHWLFFFSFGCTTFFPNRDRPWGIYYLIWIKVLFGQSLVLLPPESMVSLRWEQKQISAATGSRNAGQSVFSSALLKSRPHETAEIHICMGKIIICLSSEIRSLTHNLLLLLRQALVKTQQERASLIPNIPSS